MTHPILRRTWSKSMEGPWPNDHGWIGERLSVDDNEWYTRIHYTDASRPATILMLHGLIVSGNYLWPLANLLAKDHHVFVPDLPGSGWSKRAGEWTMARTVNDLARWMDVRGLRDVVVVANSMGCQFATMLATQRPELVRSLVMISPMVDPGSRNKLKLLGRFVWDIPRERLSIIRIWVPDLFRTGIPQALKMLVSMLKDDQMDRLSDVHQPTIVVNGERDPIVTHGWAETMADHMPAGKLLTVKNAPHAINFSAPRALLRRLRLSATDAPTITD